MRIAFAYMDFRPDLMSQYQSLSKGLVENIRSVMPEQKPIHVTDTRTKAIPGCDVLRLEINALPMTWRLLAQHFAHTLSDEILFVEPDVRFNENILNIFEHKFDIAVTNREGDTLYGFQKASEVAPYTQGTTFSRSSDFWLECAEYCNKLDRKKQLWFGDMLALRDVIDGEKYNVKFLDAAIYNHVPKDPLDFSGKVLHYKGKRKEWIMKSVEAA